MIKNTLVGVTLLFTLVAANAQKSNWQNLDLKTDSVFGISAEKAYHELLKDKTPVKVIVAICDSGIDTAHEDLKKVLWTDPKTGAHGRNFMGYEKGREDITNLAARKKDFFDSLSYTLIPDIYRKDYKDNRQKVDEFNGHMNNLNDFMTELQTSESLLDSIVWKIGKDNPSATDFGNYQAANETEAWLVKQVLQLLPQYPNFKILKDAELDHLLDLGRHHLEHGLNFREVKQEKFDLNDTNDVSNSALGIVMRKNMTPLHGTHIAGILAATRENGEGINGVADNVQVMMIKIISNIRELRDEDLAKGIRYAVDHGAKVINLSFGKPYTWDKKDVDDAVKYAMCKDVLIIHAAGNENINIDQTIIYPNPRYLDNSGYAKAWIEVGASGWKDDSLLKASFSNYGKNTVDVFAPGVDIYSTIPGNKYQSWSGTSMAAPVVAGLAALIREYFPRLSAVQVKDIIMKSVIKRDILKDKCVSGGVVNAYNALTLAGECKK